MVSLFCATVLRSEVAEVEEIGCKYGHGLLDSQGCNELKTIARNTRKFYEVVKRLESVDQAAATFSQEIPILKKNPSKSSDRDYIVSVTLVMA
ncbi:hypothetical protein Plhal703r1_c28g0113921 [Plasmopara halstedii]